MDEQKVPKKKRSLLLRVLAFLLTLILIVGAVFLIANHDRLNLDSLKRYFTYRSLERNDSGQAVSFPYSSSSSDIFATWNNDLLVCSSGGVKLYSGGGVCYIEDSLQLQQPAAEVRGDTAAIYSVGGDTVYIYRDRTLFHTIKIENSSILSVRLNQAGWLALTSQQSGYKAVITVYDDQMEKRAAFRLSSAFVTDAVITDNCKAIATVSLGQDGTAFESTLSFYPIPTQQSSGVDYDLTPSSTRSLGNNVILTMESNDSLWLLGDYGVSIWNSEKLNTWSCQDKYLKNYAFSGDFAAMLISKYRLTSQAELYTIDSNGNASVGRTINEQVLSMSAAGKYVAVLTADRLDIYTRNLDLYRTLQGTNGANEVLMRDDGSALLIGNESAHLYIPD